MHAESEHSGDDSGAGDDPHQSSTVLKSSLHHESDCAAGSVPGVPVTPEISFEEEEGQSNDSDLGAQALNITCPLSHSNA